MTGIYKITNPSGKIYIGQSVDIKRRFIDYKKSLKKQQIRLYNSIKKYGYENHIFEVVEECNIESLNERERYWQDFYNVLSNSGLNCRLTKTDDKTGRLSNETIQKLKNKDYSYLKGNLFRKNILHSEDIKKQIRNTLIENSKKPGYKNAMTGNFGELNPFYGKKHTKETLQKIQETRIKNFKPNQFKNGTLLLDNSTGIFYNSIGEAAFCLGIKKPTLKAQILGKNKNKTNLIKV